MNIPILIAVLIALLWSAGVFFGFLGTVPRAFQKNQNAVVDGKEMQRAQQTSIEETQEKHRHLMDDMKQKIEDNSKKRF